RGFTFHYAQERMFDAPTIRRAGIEHEPWRWPIFLHEKKVDIDVFITVYGEDIAVIRKTAEAALGINGEHQTWILDDGKSDEVWQLAEELGCRYVRRDTNEGAKAGNVNNALSLARGEYFAIFDADFVP